MVVLGGLHQLVEHLDRSDVDEKAQQCAKDICHSFTGSARQHHADEERLVFPGPLSSPDSSPVHHVLRLQQDHGWLEEDGLELEPQLQAAADGYSWYDLDTLRGALPVFEALYREHIALEEPLIYPEARRQQQAAKSAAASRTENGS